MPRKRYEKSFEYLVLLVFIKVAEVKVHACDTKSCTYITKEISNNMKTSVDPCVDFYEFACGNFGKHNVVPDFENSVSYFSKQRFEVLEVFSILLSQDSPESPVFRKLQEYYMTCADTSKLSKYARRDALDFFVVLGKWPVLEDDWDNEAFNWESYSNKIYKEGFPYYIIDISVDNFINDSKKNALKISPSKFGLDLEFWNKGKHSEEVKFFIHDRRRIII